MLNEITKDTPPDLTNNFLPTKRGFKMAYLNITSLTKHIDELRFLLANYPLDVISINETRLDEGILNSENYIPGYEIVRRNRNRNGRGLLLYQNRHQLFCTHRSKYKQSGKFVLKSENRIQNRLLLLRGTGDLILPKKYSHL